ncbi:MAG: hypothetical protein QM473_13910 [Acidobacteriota bacterium]|nr:hypothetical protein [Acidobacteriota bacterium]
MDRPMRWWRGCPLLLRIALLPGALAQERALQRLNVGDVRLC